MRNRQPNDELDRRSLGVGLFALAVFFFLAVFGLLLSACSSSISDSGLDDERTTGVRVGSFDFAESELVAELYAQALESNGLTVERVGTVGPREIVAPALEAGLFDLVPEYTGTAARHYSAGLDGEGAQTLDEALRQRGLMLLDPAPAENVNVFVVTVDSASLHRLEQISDLSSWAGLLRLGGPVECSTRPLCLAGLSKVYGLEFAEFVPQRSLSLTAEALLRNEIDVGVMFSTAAELVSQSFVVLEDDRNLQPEERIVPLIRIDTAERLEPTLAASLNRLSGDLTTDELQALNKAVADGMPMATVASDWLATKMSQE